MYMVLYMMTGSLPWEEIMQDESLDDFTKSSRVNQLKLEFHASAFWQTARVRLTFLDEEENSLH